MHCSLYMGYPSCRSIPGADHSLRVYLNSYKDSVKFYFVFIMQQAKIILVNIMITSLWILPVPVGPSDNDNINQYLEDNILPTSSALFTEISNSEESPPAAIAIVFIFCLIF